MKRITRGEGFSLVEITFAILVIGFGLLPVLSVFMQGTKFVEKGELYLRASIAAQNLLDLARSDDFIWVSIPNRLEVGDSSLYPQFKLPKSFVDKYKAKAVIEVDFAKGHTVIGTGFQEMRLLEITADLEWEEKEGKKTLQLVTYKALLNSMAVKTSTRM